ncbi:MAG: DUF2147 domain-containing protein [Pseudomonadota bacterium]
MPRLGPITRAVSCALLPATLLAGAAVLGGPASAQSPLKGPIEGRWVVEDGSGVVEIAPCGEALCGRVVKVRQTADPDDAELLPEDEGRILLDGFMADGATYEGTILLGEDDNISGEMVLQADGALEVSGCLLFVCDSQRWTRE